MKAAVCALCGKRFALDDGGGSVRFSDYEPPPDGSRAWGHLWFCVTHLSSAERRSDLPTAAALEELRKRYWVSWIRGWLR